MDTILYGIAEMNTSIGIVVPMYISIVVWNHCRIVVRKCGFISTKKQIINVVNHLLTDVRQFINNY